MIKKIILGIISIIFASNILAQVNASFTTNQTSGCPNPLLLILTDNSTGGPFSSYSWTLTGPAGFATQTSSNNQLSTTLTIPGFYNVSLTVCNGVDCDTETQTNYIQVFAKPTISMTLSPTTGCPPLNVCFDGTFTPGCGSITSSVVDLKDGTVINNLEDFCHAYQNSGTYNNFTVSVTNSCGCVTTQNINNPVTVSPAPIANFTANQTATCNPPMTVTFTNTSTSTVAGTTYRWDIPGLVTNVTTQNLTQSFTTTGNYDVQLIVTNPNGCSDTIIRQNYISVGDPIASFTSNKVSLCAGGNVQFTNTSSGTPTSYSWTFEGNGTSTLQNPLITYNTTGTWDVSLKVTYSGGCSDSIYMPNFITVNDLPVNSFAVSDSSGCSTPFTTTFTNTTPGAVNTVWSFPGGTPSSSNSAGPISVTYNTAGNKNVTLTTTDANGCSKTNTYNGLIAIQPLTININADTTSGCIPVTSTLGVTTSPASTISSINWTLPGSNIGTSSLNNPTAVYSNVGCNNVSVTLTTTDGCTATRTLNNYICGGNPVSGNFSVSPTSVCFEEEEVCVQFLGSGADTIFWDFGDPSPPIWGGGNSSVCYMYSQEPGDFTITMIPFQNGCAGDTIQYTDTIHVLDPVSSFSDAFNGCTDWNTFNFTDQSTNADSVYYTFGDPTSILDSSSIRNPQWTYPADDTIKTYTVTQYTYNFTTGCEHQSTQTISVYPPDANFSITDNVGCAPQTVSVNNTSFFPGGNLNTIWNWTNNFLFGSSYGGGIVNVDWNGQPSRTKVYSTPGYYTIMMLNIDNRGCLDTVIMADVVQIFGINTNFSSSVVQGCAPLSVNFFDSSDATISYVDSWHWDFGDTTTLSDTSNLQNPTYVFQNNGIYNVTLTATDSFGCTNSISKQITVFEPFASFSLSDTFICNSQSITLINSSTGNDLSYNWTFDNASPSSSGAQNPGNVTFNTEGFQNVNLMVTDSFGCSDDTTIILPVFNVVAQANADVDTISCFANIIPVSFTNTSYNNIDSASVWWDFGNGVESNIFNPSTIYEVAGTYIISMSISSLSGCSDTINVDTVYVGGPYAQIELLDQDSNCICTNVSFKITTWNAANPSFLPGDGALIQYMPNGIIGDTIIDTITYAYCQSGSFVPRVFIDDGTCSGLVKLNDTIQIDTLVSNFTINPYTLCDTGTVCFTDSSYNLINGLNGIDSWLWNFGDGGSSTLQNPCHSYQSSGFFDVTLTTYSSFNCIDSITKQIYIPPSPIVSFDQSLQNGCVGISINFWDSTQVGALSQIESWHWDFGDPAFLTDTANTQNATYTFTNPISRWVQLIVMDTFGCSGVDSVLIDVYPIPTITASNDSQICNGDTLTLNATGGSTYVWTPTTNIINDSTANPSVFPNVDTTYIVQGIDTNGCYDFDTVNIQVNNIQALFNSDTACIGNVTNFTDLSSSDGIITNWSWDFGDLLSGSNTSILQNPNHSYLNPGNYSATLSIQDDNGCISDTIMPVQVQQAPTAIIIADSACRGIANQFDASASLNGGAIITNYHWDFGVAALNTDTSNLVSPSFVYPNAGTYTVTLTVTTNQTCSGNSDDTSFVVRVYELPTALFNADTACLGNANDFTDLSSSSADASISTVHWDFNQNAADTLLSSTHPANTQFVYANAGAYFVVQTVTDSFSCFSTYSKQVFVFNNPEIDFNFSTLCQFEDNEFYALPTLADNASVTYYWNMDEGAGYQLGDSLQNMNFQNSGLHNVSLTLVDGFGCTDTITKQITITNAPIAIISGDSTVCHATSTTLSGGSSIVSAVPPTFNWNVSPNHTANITYLPNNDSYVVLEVVDANGCADTDSMFIDVLSNPTSSFNVESACEGEPLTATATASNGDGVITTYNWTINSNNSGTFNFTGSSFTNTFPIADTLTIDLTVTDNNGCSNTHTETVYIDAHVNLTLDSTLVLCPGSSVYFDLTDTSYYPQNGVGSVVWSPSNTVDFPDSMQATISPIQSTTYTITAFSALGQCPEDDDNTIIVQMPIEPYIALNAYPNPVIVGAVSDISAVVTPYNYLTDTLLWDNSSGTLNTIYGLNVEASPLAETTYNVQLIYAYQDTFCVLDTNITIGVITECNEEIIYIPNIFTPNHDGKNDAFGLTGYGIQNINFLRVFDRWGQMMFEGNNIAMSGGHMSDADGWDGNNRNGKPCDSGVYVYYYELICANGDVVKGSGNITLIK